jgi:hypothetical protein
MNCANDAVDILVVSFKQGLCMKLQEITEKHIIHISIALTQPNKIE